MVFLVTSILWLLRLRNFRPFLQAQAGEGGADAENTAESNDDSNDEVKTPCRVIEIPGERQLCLGIEVSMDQFNRFMEHLALSLRSCSQPSSPSRPMGGPEPDAPGVHAI